MAAGDRIFAARYAKNPSVAIDGITHVGIATPVVKATDPGMAGNPGTAETIVTHRDVHVTLFGTNYLALLALVGAAAANIVVGTAGKANALEKITVKSVYFDEVPQELQIPAKDAGGKVPEFAVRGTAQWGTSDTFATMIVSASDV